MADGQDTPSARRGQRPPAPHLDGPLGSSGAAPGDGPSAAGANDDPAATTMATGEAAARTTGGGAGPAPKTIDGEAVPAAAAPAVTEPDKAVAEPGTAVAEPDKAVTEPDKADGAEPGPGKTPAAGATTGETAAVEADPVAGGAAASGPGAAEKTGITAAGGDGNAKDESRPDKSGQEKSGQEKSGQEKSGQEKSGQEKSGQEKSGQEKSGQEKSVSEKDSPEKSVSKKDGQEKTASEKENPETATSKKDGQEKDGAAKKGDGEESTVPTAAAVAAASRGRTTKVLRAANPVRVVRNTARSTSAWAKRPSGRLILPAIIAFLLLGAAGTAGAYLVPQALQSVPSPSVTPGFGQDAGASAGPGPVVAPSISGVPGLPGSTTAPAVGGTLPPVPPAGAGNARPADVLANWAQQAGTRAGIPVVAVQAYGYAELVVARATPSCHLTWTTIAAIAKVESSHGSHNGAVLNVDGSVSPPILGLPLDGKGGRQLIADTDHGALDGDSQFDRAMGPLQFIPQTWTAISAGNGVDADNNGFSDPNDIDDASLAAAKYLCQGGRDLSKPDAWWDAILSYNAVRPYAQKVFDAANEYGQRSRA